jgi:hypothetical protein
MGILGIERCWAEMEIISNTSTDFFGVELILPTLLDIIIPFLSHILILTWSSFPHFASMLQKIRSMNTLEYTDRWIRRPFPQHQPGRLSALIASHDGMNAIGPYGSQPQDLECLKLSGG